MSFDRQSTHDFLDDHPWYRPYGNYNYKTSYHPFFNAQGHASLVKGAYAPQNRAVDPLMRLEHDIASAPPEMKTKVVINALKTNPKMTDEIIKRSFELTPGKVERAGMKADLIAFNPLLAHKIADLPSGLTETTGTDLRSVGTKIRTVVATMGEKSGVENSQLADNLDFSHFGSGVLNLKGVMSGGTTFGAQTIEANQSTQIHQEKPDVRLVSQNADTGHQRLNEGDFDREGQISSEVATTGTSKVTPDGTMLPAKHSQPQWALDGVIPAAPSPFRTAT